jgi:hypothetical protein
LLVVLWNANLLHTQFFESPEGNKYTRLREAIVIDQIQERVIKDKAVLDPLRKLKHHLFVQEAYRHLPSGLCFATPEGGCMIIPVF